MFTASSHIFKIKKKIIQVKCLAPNHVNHEYLQYINKSRFILYKNKDLVKQIAYIRRIKISKKKFLFGFFFKNKLIGTSGFQKVNTNVPTVGIFIFDKNFLKKKLSHIFTGNACIFFNKIIKKTKISCGISNKNLASIKMFKKLGFKPYYKRKNVTFYKSTIDRIKMGCF